MKKIFIMALFYFASFLQFQVNAINLKAVAAAALLASKGAAIASHQDTSLSSISSISPVVLPECPNYVIKEIVPSPELNKSVYCFDEIEEVNSSKFHYREFDIIEVPSSKVELAEDEFEVIGVRHHNVKNYHSPLQEALMDNKYTLAMLQDPNVDINEVDKYGNTALHTAVGFGRVVAVRTLLNRPDIDTTLVNRYGQTARMAAEQSSENRYDANEILEMFKKHDGDVDPKLNAYAILEYLRSFIKTK